MRLNSAVAPRPTPGRLLTQAEFQTLRDVPPESEWFANLNSPGTRRMYQMSIREFMRLTGIVRPEEFRQITRAHVIAWRKDLMARNLAGATIRAKLAALSSLYQYLCDKHAVPFNPVKGVSRPKIDSYEGKTPAISDGQVRALLTAPKGNGLKAKRDRAILSALFYHALRRQELRELVDGLHVRVDSFRALPGCAQGALERSVKSLDVTYCDPNRVIAVSGCYRVLLRCARRHHWCNVA